MLNLIGSMQKDIHSAKEVPRETKLVVLVISGQAGRNIGLDPRLCDAYPLLHEHLQTCRTVLRYMGYPDIMPALFQSGPISDLVSLECATFAVQYACARCWMDSGLKIHTVIGHSFGELTALALTRTLSLKDTLTLIAKRASLVRDKWGPEFGTMLAVHGDKETAQAVVEHTPGHLETACYNGPNSHVLVGGRTSVSEAETVIQTNFRHCGLRYQNVDVSRGFHSFLTESILDELHDFAKGLTFHEARIPWETCTKGPVKSVTPEYVSRHCRSPVYFVDAIRRIEKQLGDCIWLEAGWDSPVVPMTRKAVARPESHMFYAVNDVSSISKITSNLWLEGFSISYWGFLTPRKNSLKQIWIPPHREQCSQHWLDVVDHATARLQSPRLLQETRVVRVLAFPSPHSGSFKAHNHQAALLTVHCIPGSWVQIRTRILAIARPLEAQTTQAAQRDYAWPATRATSRRFGALGAIPVASA